MAPKETLRASEAKRTIIQAKRAFFAALELGGIILEEGKPDADGKPFTTARIHEIRQKVDDALWESLEDGYVIEENMLENMLDDEAGSPGQ